MGVMGPMGRMGPIGPMEWTGVRGFVRSMGPMRPIFLDSQRSQIKYRPAMGRVASPCPWEGRGRVFLCVPWVPYDPFFLDSQQSQIKIAPPWAEFPAHALEADGPPDHEVRGQGYVYGAGFGCEAVPDLNPQGGAGDEVAGGHAHGLAVVELA